MPVARHLSIPQRIKLARETRNIAPGLCAQVLGYAKPQYSWWRIEHGERGLTPAQLGRLCEFLGVSCHWMILGYEYAPKKKRAAA
jgi:hypothetical protein